MDADQFYEEFKAALKFFGLSWGEKNLVGVSISGGELVLTYKHYKVSIDVNNW